MIISCPHCQTKYQVAYEAIGSAGRKVKCAHCSQAWSQVPIVETPSVVEEIKLTDLAEDLLDEAMAEAARTRSRRNTTALVEAIAEPVAPEMPDLPVGETTEDLTMPPPNAAELKQRQAEFSRRQNALSSRLPLARLRRGARLGSVLLLSAVLATGYFARVQLVERYPELAGIYSSIGLGVNVVGLEFTKLQTLRSLSQGKDVLTVSAQIVGVARKPVPVPPVVVSLLDGDGRAVYEWSVNPRVPDLMVGETATFDTRLTLPPANALRVRLSFSTSGGGVRSVTEQSSRAAVPQAVEPIAHAGISATR
jgi:predicted Zn finger-like uncharacterized protein